MADTLGTVSNQAASTYNAKAKEEKAEGAIEKAREQHSSGAATGATKAATVKLSSAAQVRQLQHQGLTASQIASKLGISVITVNGYLGSGTNTATTAETTTPQPNSPTEKSTETVTEK
ncbi:MAG: hypothetical protein HQL03_12960 [Nitrospirae bacterium]|nr:hypothetical protein [Nitrospirota bacterium]